MLLLQPELLWPSLLALDGVMLFSGSLTVRDVCRHCTSERGRLLLIMTCRSSEESINIACGALQLAEAKFKFYRFASK